MLLNFNWYKFSEFSLEQLYALLKLRSEVFVVEQKSPYLDPDGEDVFARHLLGTKEGELMTYCRLFLPSPPDNCLVFGRVLTAETARNCGYGKQLIHQLLAFCEKNYKNVPIKCSAQDYLVNFYGSFGFKTIGDVYDDVGVPHIDMQKGEF